MYNYKLFMIFFIVTSITIYLYGFTISKIVIPLIVYFVSLKRDSLIDKEMKESIKKDKNNTI